MNSTLDLILVPGLLCDQTVWEYQADSLRGRARIEIADHGHLDSLGKMAEKILDWAPGRFAISGHSMGAKVALEVFRRAPERLLGIALMDSAPTAIPAGSAGE